jgi:hypothetical protein
MIWWFLILGLSTLVVVCVAIALYMRLRKRLKTGHAHPEDSLGDVDGERRANKIES